MVLSLQQIVTLRLHGDDAGSNPAGDATRTDESPPSDRCPRWVTSGHRLDL